MATDAQNPIRKALRDMSRTELERTVQDIYDILFLEIDDSTNTFTINPDKECDADSIDLIVGVLQTRGLYPIETYIDVVEETVPDRQEKNVPLG